VIEKFTSGEFNILVATCIGEEGLDIGELDMTICYDSDKTPTRMVGSHMVLWSLLKLMFLCLDSTLWTDRSET